MSVVSSLVRVSTSGLVQPSCVIANEVTSLPITSSPSPPSIPKSGFVGGGRFAKNFRLLFVNGCSYEEWESRAAAGRISKLFGRIVGKEIKVHYAYLPMTFAQVIGALRYGIEPQGCDVLLANIRERLQELNIITQKKIEGQLQDTCRLLTGGPRLAIFLHSGGGAFLKQAMEKLTREERQQIDVFGFGSACLFDKKDFHNVVNSVAYWDPFPLLGRVLSGHGFSGSSAPVMQVGSSWQMPVVSHKFFNLPYQKALEKIVETYANELKTR